ncbi:hypothetical protein L1887_01368 [Cichorium endivia]|nr:hypothetical protein L1887_01368 [Cichorium endivia]
MLVDPDLLYDSDQFWNGLSSCVNMTAEYQYPLGMLVYQSRQQNRYSKPMPWIGMYIALASLFCILAMVADLLNGLRNRKLWFPCKYFNLNAASLTVIAVAIKLPMDLTNLMPGYVDQTAKLGSVSLMCTMMANLLPSLATMESKEVFTNMIALGVLVITLAVNLCIQINTKVLSYHVDKENLFQRDDYYTGRGVIATIYVGLLLILLIIYVCSCLAILKYKQILETKYQVAHEIALKDEEMQQPGRLSVEKLKEYVSNYWIMAGTGNPQFMTACSATTSASGVICALSTVLHIIIMLSVVGSLSDYNSDYKWSMLVIFIVQFIGVIVGTVAPLSRCFAALSFKLSVKWIWNHIKVFKVESYWIQNLSDWEQSSIPFPSSSRKCKIVIQSLKIVVLSSCIGLQSLVVVGCKMIAMIPSFIVICVLFCSHCWERLKAMFSTTGILFVQKPEVQLGEDRDLSGYVLQLHDDMEFAERTLKGILKSLNNLILKAEKQKPKNLLKLLAGSKGFEGVEKIDRHYVPPLLSDEYLNCWSLPLVTLTTIAMSLPNIEKNIVDSLLSGVSEGLAYVTLVEETLNATDDHASIQKAAQTLWVEVEVYHKWLGYKLPKPVPQVCTTEQILQCLRDTAKSIVTDVESTDIGVPNGNSKCMSISANSMYCITETILLSYHENIDQVSQKELFAQLSSMIADILAACLTNLPKVIAMKCHTSATEKREASVQAAAQLLGEATQIIQNLQARELPNVNPDELAFIDNWHTYLNDPFP